MKVFISHSSDDHDFVLKLSKKLKEDLIDVWVDDWEIKVGDSIVQKINEGLENSSFFIIVLSKYSLKSSWVLKELNSALMLQLTKKDIKILPIFLEINPEDAPPLLRDIHGVKFSRNFINRTQYEKLIEPIKEKAISEEIIKFQDIYFDNIIHIDLILDKKRPTRDEVEFILKLMKKKHYENYFFRKVSTINWFVLLKKEGYFDADRVPGPEPTEKEGFFYIPEWNVLQYLERISQQVKKPENGEYINELLEIIKNVTEYHVKNVKSLDNYRTWYYFVKILLNIPNEKIPLDIIDLIPTWLDSKFDSSVCGSEIAINLLKKFLNDNPEDIKKAEKLIDYITNLKSVPLSKEKAKIFGKKEENKFIIDPYWLEKAFKKYKYAELIGEKCTYNVINVITGKIKSLLKKEVDGTYRSFYQEKSYITDEPLELLTFILKTILLIKANIDIDSTRTLLRNYLEDKYLYFVKMAIFVIGQNMDKYSNLFWEILDTEIGIKIMANTLYLGDELKVLLNNLNDFSDEQRIIIAKKIEESAKSLKFEEEPEKYRALHKQEIYEALSHDHQFKKLYEEMKKITNIDVRLHPAIEEAEVRWGPGSSPLRKEEIIQMSNIELAEYLKTFKTEDFWKGPTVGGLADLLEEVARENPEKFINNLNPFKNVSFIYVYKILHGIRNAWNNKKTIEWNKLFQFLEEYINREEFWDNKLISDKDKWPDKADNKWIISTIADLIQDGTRDDAWAFPEKYFDNAEKILFLILDKLKPDEYKEINDYVGFTLNTPFGSTITAMILLSLRMVRMDEKRGIEKDTKWKTNFREKYNKILDKKIIEGFTNLGRYLPNLHYLDNAWVEAKIKNLEDKKGTEYWEAFMQGYLSSNRIYNKIYKIMRDHYKFAIDFEFKEKQYSKHLVEHISIAYLMGIESIDEPKSLFKQILDNFKHEQVSTIIGLFWMQRDYINKDEAKYKDTRKRILNFWDWLYRKYKDKEFLENKDKRILSNAVKLAIILPEINDEYFKWLMLSATYVNVDYNASFLIEYLNELKDKSKNKKTAEYIGEIFLKMLKSFPIIPDYNRKHIISIVEYLYKSKAGSLADEICNIYGKNGYLFLREVYEKYTVND